MSWHPALSIEVAAEFRRLSAGSPWTRLENRAWFRHRNQRLYNATPERAAKERARLAARYRTLTTESLRAATCVICGSSFPLTKARAYAGVTACSYRCGMKAAGVTKSSTYTIGGVTRTLGEWCALRGLAKSTVRHRIERGVAPNLALEISP